MEKAKLKNSYLIYLIIVILLQIIQIYKVVSDWPLFQLKPIATFNSPLSRSLNLHHPSKLSYGSMPDPPISSQTEGSDMFFQLQFSLIHKIIGQKNQLISSVKDQADNFQSNAAILKTNTLKEFFKYMPEPEAALIGSMIFGNSVKIDDQLSHYFEVTGMQHVVAASGSNVSLMMMLATTLCFPFLGNRLTRTLVLMSSVGLYISLAGIQPPLIRASVMAVLSLWAVLLNRQVRSWFSLLLAATVMLIFEPSYLTSISFQLSIMATLSLILFYAELTKGESILHLLEVAEWQQLSASHHVRLHRSPISRLLHQVATPFYDSLIMTIAAQILVLPLLMFHFGQLSLISFLANTCLLWLVPIITLSGTTLMLLLIVCKFSLIIQQLVATTLGFFVWGSTAIFIAGMQFFGRYESLLKNVSFSQEQVVIWWFVCGCCFILPKLRHSRKKAKFNNQFWREITS